MLRRMSQLPNPIGTVLKTMDKLDEHSIFSLAGFPKGIYVLIAYSNPIK